MRFNAETIERWKKMVNDFVAEHCNGAVDDVLTGSMAWEVAHRAGITGEAYKDRTVVDAHIKTALQKIFPNAVFKDSYHY